MITEVTSNTALSLLLIPILGDAALASNVISDPAIIMTPATICGLCAFMLRVATPPNAFVFASGRLMAKEGLLLNISAAVIIATFFYLIYY